MVGCWGSWFCFIWLRVVVGLALFSPSVCWRPAWICRIPSTLSWRRLCECWWGLLCEFETFAAFWRRLYVPWCLIIFQVFVRFEGFVSFGHVMPEEDRAFSLSTMLSLLPSSWPGLLLRMWCFSTIEDVPSFLSLWLKVAEGPCDHVMFCRMLQPRCWLFFDFWFLFLGCIPLYISEVFT